MPQTVVGTTVLKLGEDQEIDFRAAIERENKARAEQKQTKYSDSEIREQIDIARAGLMEGLNTEVELQRAAEATIAQAMIMYNNMIDARWR